MRANPSLGNTVDPANAAAAPSVLHWLGTDSVGRDVWARILHGARVDLLMAVAGVAGPFVLGTAIGLIAGYAGGWLDSLLMRILEVTISFPYFVLVIAIVAALLGFGGVAGTAMEGARIVFWVAIIIAVISFVVSLVRRA